MAIKYNNKQVKVVKFDNNDVKKIIKDKIVVWEKPYTLTESSVDSSVVTYKWKTTNEPSVAAGSIITKTKKSDTKFDAEVYNEDTITLSYNTDISKGAIADIVRVDGVEKASGASIAVSKDVNVEVIAVGKPASLVIDLDQGVNRFDVKYVDTNGQVQWVEFEDSATHTISDIWSGSEVTYWVCCKSGYTVTQGPAEHAATKWIADGTKTVQVRTGTEPVSLSLSWPAAATAGIASVYVEYTDNNGVLQKVTKTTTGNISTNVKYGSSYYWKLTLKSGTTLRFPFTEDFGDCARSHTTIWIDVDYVPCIIRINWAGLDERIKWVQVKYQHAELTGYQTTGWIKRNSSWSDIEKARKGSTAELVKFQFTKAGCYIDTTKKGTSLELTENTNYFEGLSVAMLDTDGSGTVSYVEPELTVKLRSGYTSADITYITRSAEEETLTINGSTTLKDIAKGSDLHYTSGSISGKRAYPGYSRDFFNEYDSDGQYKDTITIPLTRHIPATAEPEPKVENPVYRNIKVKINEHINSIRVRYYDVDSDGYLWYRSRTFSSDTTFRALVGYYVRWHAYGNTGCIGNPEDGALQLTESKTDYVISPVAVPTYGVIRTIFNKNVESISITYYNSLTGVANNTPVTVVKTPNDAGIDITDALLSTRYTWTATAAAGCTLQKSKGSGTVSKYYYESKISPEVDTEPFDIVFQGSNVDLGGTRGDASPGDILEETRDSSRGVMISCKTASGGYRWDTIISPLQDTTKYTYEGDITFDKQFPLTLTESLFTKNTSTNRYNPMYITVSGITEEGVPYAVNGKAGTGVYAVYRSTSTSTSSNDPVDAKYPYNSTVYLFAVVPKSNIDNGYYTVPRGWTGKTTLGSNYYIYRAKTITVKDASTNTTANDYTLDLTPAGYTITLDDTYVTWNSSTGGTATSMTAYYGDTLSKPTSTTISCQRSDGTQRWAVQAIKRTADVQYQAVTGTMTINFQSGPVTGNQTITVSGLSRPLQQYAVTLSPTSLTAVSSLFLSENNMATSGHASGTKFDYNKTVYGIAKVPTSNLSTYVVPSGSSGWTYKQTSGNYAYYTVGSVKVDGSPVTGETISVSALTEKVTFTITFSGTGVTWKSNNKAVPSLTAYKNDTVRNINSKTVTCAYADANGNLCERWRAVAEKAIDSVSTTYSGTPKITDFSWIITSDKTVSAGGVTSSTRNYTVQIKLPTNASSTYISTSATATSGTTVTSATSVKYNSSTYYGFVKIASSVMLQYSPNANWEYVKTRGGYEYYKVWSGKINTLGTYDPGQLAAKSWTITLPTTYVNWKDNNNKGVTYKTAYTGDILSVSGTRITCLSNLHSGWTVNATRNTNTAQYTYEGTPKITVTSPVKGAQTVGVSGITRKTNQYTVRITKPTYAGANVRRAVVSTTYTPSNGSVGTKASLTVDYGTEVYGFIVFDKGFDEYYIVPSDWTLIHYDDSEEIWRVGSETATTNCSIRYQDPTRATGTVNVTKASYMSSVYLATSSTATQGQASGYTYNAGELVYAFATLTSAQNDAYNIPSSWSYIGYYGAYYHYRIGSRYVREGSNTISYTAATAKPTLSLTSADMSLYLQGNYYVLQLHNSNSTSLTANVSWYTSGGTYISSTTVGLGSYGTSTSAVLAKSTNSSVYARVYFYATGYVKSPTVSSNTCSWPALADPEIVSEVTEVIDGADTTSGAYRYKHTVRVKNNNNIMVDVTATAFGGGSFGKTQVPKTIPANGTATFVFSIDASCNIRLGFSASGYRNSAVHIYITIGDSGGGGDDGGRT